MKRPIRVLLLCDRLDIAGGVERFVCAMANHLSREGMEVAVGSVSTRRASVRYPLDAAVRVLTGEEGRLLGDTGEAASRLGRAWRMLRTQWRIGRALGRLIRSHQPDVVVLNGLTTACSVLALDSGHAARSICCDHNHFSARSRLWQGLRRWLYPQVGAIVSLTETDAPRFRALNPRTQVIYNAASLRADSPALPDTGIVLAVGRHVAQKGFDLLLRAWAIVAKAQPLVRLRIVGDGPLRAEHEALAQTLGVAGRVEWLAPTAEIERHYREATVFALSSRYEGMPIALLEAQALGVPAVAFDCPTGPGEILTAQTGRLVPPGDVNALAAALTELLRSPGLRAAMGQAAIARSRALFSPQAHEQRWAALVRDVAAKSADGVPA
jgi:glycosyltransferase involved in cell wall biosynthesis